MTEFMKHRWILYLVVLACFAAAIFTLSRKREVAVENSKSTPAPQVTVATAAQNSTPTPIVEGTSEVVSPTPTQTAVGAQIVIPITPFDPTAYDTKMLELANLSVVKVKHVTTSTTPTGTVTSTVTYTTSTAKSAWPVKGLPYPNAGAVLPGRRVVAYYGNFFSKFMGVLGQYPPNVMLEKLTSTTAAWTAADPNTPALPAIDYIAVTAQGSPGADGMYRARMPATEIQKAINLAAKVNGIVVLDVQVGLSTVQKELPLLAPYLKLPQVHLALDPEFAMHNGLPPGKYIGTMDAADINWAANYLAQLVRDNNLPPKMLVVHRFTYDMVTHARAIRPLPEVQVVMDMDGFGSPAKKIGTYTQVVLPEPVQFTGWKLFYKNDAVTYGNHLMTPEEVLKLSPRPSFIQYQ